jgi:hypothetical protein
MVARWDRFRPARVSTLTWCDLANTLMRVRQRSPAAMVQRQVPSRTSVLQWSKVGSANEPFAISKNTSGTRLGVPEGTGPGTAQKRGVLVMAENWQERFISPILLVTEHDAGTSRHRSGVNTAADGWTELDQLAAIAEPQIVALPVRLE